jgi:hypothetical protein
MIIQIINIERVAVLESKYNPIVFISLNRVKAFIFAFQFVKVVAWRVHIFDVGSRIQSG